MVRDVSVDRIQFSGRSSNRLINTVALATIIILVIISISWVFPRLYGVGAGRVSSQQLVVIDTDPGIDDAAAIFTALGDISVKVLGITCVRGNTNVSNVAKNSLKIMQVAHKNNVPVYSGYNYGLVESPTIDDWFGKDGLGDIPFPDPLVLTIQKEQAANFLARIVKQYPGEITVFAIGPLTNIALALHLNPDFLDEVRRLVVLGGSTIGRGNAAPGVEYNFYMDPAAANFLLARASSKRPITLMPLETCEDNPMSKSWRWNTLAKINNSVVSFLNTLESKYLEMHPSSFYKPYDVFAVAVVLAPNAVLHSVEMYGYVENSGLKSKGALMIDYFNITNTMANLEVIKEVNSSAIQNLMFENLSNF